MNCLHCGATNSNGLALCALCQTFAKRCLDLLPVYFGNLARWRPGRAGSRPVPGSRVLYDGEWREGGSSDRVSRALDETGADLSGWARCLSDDRGVTLPRADDEASAVAAACVLLSEHLTSVATLEWAGEFVRKLGVHEAALRSLTETVVPGWYAGACRRCTAPTHVVPGLTWVTCGACGATTYARDHLDAVLNEARDWVARPKAIAEAVVALVDTEQSVPRLHDRIRKWESLDWLTPTRRLDSDGDPVGPKRYRFGDVLDMVLGTADAPTRAKRASSA